MKKFIPKNQSDILIQLYESGGVTVITREDLFVDDTRRYWIENNEVHSFGKGQCWHDQSEHVESDVVEEVKGLWLERKYLLVEEE